MSAIRPARRRTQLVVAGSALAVSALVSGCGVAGTDFQPGVAAQVGDQRVSADHVDTVAQNYCAAIEEQISQDSTVLPRRLLRAGVAGQLALVAAAEQLAEEYGVVAGQPYAREVARLETAVSELPEEVQDAVVEVESSAAYVNEVLLVVGAEVSEPGATQDQLLAGGRGELVRWIKENDVEIAPQYGVELVDGQAVPVDTSLSVAVGDTAQKGLAAEPDPAYAAGLSQSQRCG